MYRFAEIYVLILIFVNIIAAMTDLYQLIKFINYSKRKFLSVRKPALVITYCVISLTISFIISPLNWYFQIFYLESAAFLFEFLHEILNAFLIIIILGRCWLLYYDYQFSNSHLDKMWRGAIDPNEGNFWLTNRKKWGLLNANIICTGIMAELFALTALCIVGFFIHAKGLNTIAFHYFTMFIFGIPFGLILIYFMCKINNISDIYLISKELKYLSIIILARSVALLFDVFIFSHNHLFFYTTELFTQWMAVWIQCWWVVKKYKVIAYEQRMSMSTMSLKLDTRTIRVGDELQMVDIFEHKMATEALLRHCVNELSIESSLFLIEVAQFKARLNMCNVQKSSLVYVYNQFDANSSAFVNAVMELQESVQTPSKQQDIYKQFQDHILNHTWLPMALPVQILSADIENKISEANLKETDASIHDSDHSKHVHANQCDITWIFGYSKHLYTKYVDESSALCINIEHQIRQSLVDVFCNKNVDDARKQIRLIHHEHLLNVSINESDELLFMKCYLYHCFDCAFDSIWKMVKNDTFHRFKKTMQYHELCKKLTGKH